MTLPEKDLSIVLIVTMPPTKDCAAVYNKKYGKYNVKKRFL